MAKEDIVISIGGDDSNFRKTWTRLNNDVKNSGLTALNKQFQDTGKSADRFNAFLKNVPGGIDGITAASFKATTATRGLGNATKEVGSGLLNATAGTNSLRYALYDVANSAQAVSDTLIGLASASISTFAAYESAFTSVERTTGVFGSQLETLRGQLLDLSTSIPFSFGQITEIASLGAQLGVAAEDIASFTDTVAKFSAVTNVTTTNAAQSFGALGELLNISSDEYRNLASSIAYAGVNAVATESEILSVSTAIAGVAANAGVSAQYVIGLSTSLASLRVPAEQSRGALTRVFQEISRSASVAGPSLDQFARVIGTTSEEAKNLANTDMETFFNKLLVGLSGMDAMQLTNTLDALSLSDIRVTNTLARLSDNMDLVNKSMSDVNSSYVAGTQLNDAFGSVVDDLASKFTLLDNAFKEFQATAGEGLATAIKPAIDGLVDFLKVLSDIGKSPVGGSVLSILAGIAGVVGVIGAVVAAAATGGAAFLALRTAFIATTTGASAMNNSLINLVGVMLKVPGATGTAGAALRAFGASAFSAANLTKTAGGIMKAALPLALISIALEVGTAAWEQYADSQKTSLERAKDAANEYFGSAGDALTQGLIKDMKEGSVAIQEISTTFVENKNRADSWVSGLESAIPAQVALTEATTSADKAIKSQTISYSENGKAALANILANNEAIQKLFSDNTFKGTNVNSEKLFASILGDPLEGGRKYLDSVYAGIQQRLGEGSQINIAEMVGLQQEGGGFNSGAMVALLGQELGITAAAAQELLDKYVKLEGVVAATTAQIATSASVAAATAAANEAVGKSADDVAEAAANQAEEMSKFVDQLFDVVNGAQETAGALDELGQAFATGGDEAAVGSGALQSAIQAIIAENPQEAAGKLQFLLNYILANVPGATSTISFLQQAIAGLGGTKAPISFDISSFTRGLNSAGKSAGSAAKAVRTLKDYASDLAKVFDRAFEIRFSSTEELDNINAGWQAMAKSIADANKEIDDLNVTIGELTADKALQEYFLQVAEAQGDMISAARIRANLAKINAQLTDQQEQLSDAQAQSSKTLVGNSAAAIANRKTIREMVQGYQAYIQTLASSGASQEELAAATEQARQDFVAQATQLGYNSDELETYAKAFDDVTVAINNVPRNITVDVDTDPAIQALKEFEAQAAKSGATSGSSFAAAYAEALAKKARGDALLARISAVSAVAQDPSNAAATRVRNADYAQQLSNIYNSGQYAEGGYTGAGGKYDVAGVVHRGEYVVPKDQVNQSTGLPYFMSQMPKFYSGGATTGNGGNMMVSLSPEDRAILRSAGGSGNIVLYADSKELARSVNDGNRQIVASGGRP